MLGTVARAGGSSYRVRMEASATNAPGTKLVSAPRSEGRLLQRFWALLSGVWAALMGLLPHVLHHIGPLAGAALFAGVLGSLLFGALGLLAAVPFLLRLHRRSGGWRAPGVALSLFLLVFSLSTFVIGPAINGSDEGTSRTGNSSPADNSATAPPGVSQSAHEQHH